MKLPFEKGVFSNSEFYELTPSQRAENTLFYLQRAGHFYCNTQYTVSRDHIESFLFVIIIKGNLQVYCNNSSYVVSEGNAAFINCYEPHAYHALTKLEYIWLHFDGANTKSFYDEIIKEKKSTLFTSIDNHIKERSLQILQQLYTVGTIEETFISRNLHDLLCELLYDFTGQESDIPLILSAQQYIKNNLDSPINVNDIANYCNMSTSHFNRLFRRHTGQSPYEFCVNQRINKAKYLLKKTELSISEIADATGYEYDTSFTSAFTKKVGLSPRSYRNMPI